MGTIATKQCTWDVCPYLCHYHPSCVLHFPETSLFVHMKSM